MGFNFSDENYINLSSINNRLKNKFQFIRLESNDLNKFEEYFKNDNYGLIFDDQLKKDDFFYEIRSLNLNYFFVLNLKIGLNVI